MVDFSQCRIHAIICQRLTLGQSCHGITLCLYKTGNLIETMGSPNTTDRTETIETKIMTTTTMKNRTKTTILTKIQNQTKTMIAIKMQKRKIKIFIER